MKPKLFFGLMLAFLWGCSEGDKPIQPQEVSDNSSIEFIEPEPDSVIVNSYELNRVVKHFMASADIKPTLSRSRPTEAIVNGAGNIQAYVTNFGNNQGYVVVSATKDYLPIIAWSKTDNFEVANMPEPVKEWFTDLDEAISSKDNKKNRKKYHEFWRQFEKVHQPKIREARALTISVEDWQVIQTIISDSLTSWRNQSFDVYTLDQLELEKPELFDKYDEMARSTIWCEYEDDYRLVSYVVFKGIPTTIGPINPLMETQWDQRSGFNQSYPIRYLNGVPYLPPAGCGPVALGQIMYYHKYPANINWAGMDKDNGTKVTSDFLLDIATRANADIQALETFNDETGIMNTLMSYNYQYSFATKDFQNKAMQSLRNRRPVYVANCMYKSDGKKTGHAWVLDDAFSSTIGETVEFWTCMNKRKFEMHYWDTQYYNPGTSYHINWGWGGDNNGYYTNWENFTPSQYHNGSIQYLFYDIHP